MHLRLRRYRRVNKEEVVKKYQEFKKKGYPVTVPSDDEFEYLRMKGYDQEIICKFLLDNLNATVLMIDEI